MKNDPDEKLEKLRAAKRLAQEMGVWPTFTENGVEYIQVPKGHAMTTGIPAGLIIQSEPRAPFVNPDAFGVAVGSEPTLIVRDELYKWQRYQELLEARKMTPNQILEAEGMNPISGGDEPRPVQLWSKKEVSI